MSVIYCADCQRAVDTDHDECITILGPEHQQVCGRCAMANYPQCDDCGAVFDGTTFADCPGCAIEAASR